MIIIFEGRDAAGKGGTIRRVTRYMNEKHYRVVALGKPTAEQRTQWFFQKYVAQFPRGGEIVLFDRSWYNRAMVEPALGFCTELEHKNFMRGVVGFEKDLARQGTVLLKLYFSVTKEEQARRFERRKTDPLRQWKLTRREKKPASYPSRSNTATGGAGSSDCHLSTTWPSKHIAVIRCQISGI